jgi:hypothetical protein
MMRLVDSIHHRDSSHLTVLRMTSAIGHVILSEAKDPYDESIGRTISVLIRFLRPFPIRPVCNNPPHVECIK